VLRFRIGDRVQRRITPVRALGYGECLLFVRVGRSGRVTEAGILGQESFGFQAIGTEEPMHE